MAAARPARPRALHVLRGSHARSLVRRSGVRAGDLVLDLGAGTGVITHELVRCGCRVVAVELDPRLAARLRRRFASTPSVRVLEADALHVALPREPFRVVANIPFHVTTALIRRLLGHGRQMVRADLIVQWGAALKRSRLGGNGRWSVELGPRITASAFNPAPPVDAGVLTITRRKGRTPSRGGGRGS